MKFIHPIRPIFLAVLISLGGVALTFGEADFRKLAGVIPDPNRPGFIMKSGPVTLEVADKVVIPYDVFSVCSFTVEDGASATDFLLSNGVAETGGSCGFVKDGPGTMVVSGPVKLAGVISVYDGTLDFAKAALTPGLRVNVLGNGKFIPPVSGTQVSELYVNNDKLKPGAWGAPGSVAAGKANFESPQLGGIVQVPDSGPSRRETWMRLKYGIFSHYVWNGYGMAPGWPNADGSHAANIDEFAEILDVPNYVDQLVKAGVQYCVFTAWHSGTCPLFPSAAMAKWAPDRKSCPKRDLLGDLADACRAKGIRFYFYVHPYQPVSSPHNDWLNDLFAELVDRYGDRLDGLWMDENFSDGTQDRAVDYPRLMKTIRERNPDLVLVQNGGANYGVDGVQEVQWEVEEGRAISTYQLIYNTGRNPESMLITTVMEAAANSQGGGVQWTPNAEGAGKGTRGGIDHTQAPLIDGFAKLLEPIAESVKNTSPSSSFLPPFQGTVVRKSGLKWGVATKAHDESREYLHVLVPPTGDALILPPPADGKVFTNARLLASGRPVKLVQDDRGISLTLPEGTPWVTPDTVIAMDVLCRGGAGLVNNTSRSISYRGSSWAYQSNRNLGEFRNDAHVASADGDSFSFNFIGTDVEWISSRGSDRGVVELAIDGVSQGTVDLSKGSGSFQKVFSKSGLPRGTHTLTGTKRGGIVMTVDAFKVTELVNDSDPGVTFADSRWFGVTSAQLGGSWEPRGNTWINGQSFSFDFEGTAVELFGGSAWNYADLELTLDGKPHSTIHISGDNPNRSLAKISNLSLGKHTLAGNYTNRCPGGFLGALDGFKVTRPDYWNSQSKRGSGDYQNDVHYCDRRGGNGSYTFNGSGVEVIVTRDPDSRAVSYTLSGNGSSMQAPLNHYAPVRIPQSSVFRYPTLVPGTYTVGFYNECNPQGIGFSVVRLSIDAFRIYKAESSSATPLMWGENGQGGDGTWDVNATANWRDITGSVKWLDFGANDHSADFAGKGGTIRVAAPVRVNRLAFRADRYVLIGQSLELTGDKPMIYVADRAKAVLALPVQMPDGTPLAVGTYTASSHPQLVTGGGVLSVEAPR
jgi:alpha-L-fucosidase